MITKVVLEIKDEAVKGNKEFDSALQLVEKKIMPLSKEGVFVKKVESVTEDEKLMDKQVYRLCGEDVLCVLDGMANRDESIYEIIEDKEKLERVIDYVSNKLEIHWMEEVEATIQCALDMDRFDF